MIHKRNTKALREYKQTITLNPEQKEVIVGTLLGDACLPLQNGKRVGGAPRFCVQFEQNIADYVHYLYDKNFTGTPPRVKNLRGGGQSVWFRTYGNPEFKFYDSLFYPIHEYKGSRRKKRVPENLHELLTPRALGFMDDGARSAHYGPVCPISPKIEPIGFQRTLFLWRIKTHLYKL